MCLAVPMKLLEITPDGGHGVADLDGARYDVNLDLIEAPLVGDFVIVHAGFAIERLDHVEADARLSLFEQLAATHRGGGG
jgi:hydrogenase expression/formation protein HypC